MPATAQPRPFAAVLLQLYTKRPQLAYNGAQRGTPAAARAELWRYALAEAVGTEGALAARAFAKVTTLLSLSLTPTPTPTLSLTCPL